MRATAKSSARACAVCGGPARRVAAVTIKSLVADGARAALPSEDGFRFCPAPSCDVVYSHESGATVGTGDVKVDVFQKSTAGERTLCYCFDYSVADVHADVADKRVLADIEDKCQRGLERCEAENPQGCCCLANVRRVYAEAERSSGAPGAVELDGCAAKAVTSSAAASAVATDAGAAAQAGEVRAVRWAAGGAIFMALASSACCWLPLSLIALGASASGAGVFFEAHRFWFLGGTAALLGLGFYFVYLRAPRCEAGDACAVPTAKLVRLNKVMLWAAAAFALTFALFPNYVGHLVGGSQAPTAQAAQLPVEGAAVTSVTRSYAIVGMSCEGCMAHINETLAKVPGVTSVDVVYAEKVARVTFASAQQADDALILAAIDESGFEGSVERDGAN